MIQSFPAPIDASPIANPLRNFRPIDINLILSTESNQESIQPFGRIPPNPAPRLHKPKDNQSTQRHLMKMRANESTESVCRRGRSVFIPAKVKYPPPPTPEGNYELIYKYQTPTSIGIQMFLLWIIACSLTFQYLLHISLVFNCTWFGESFIIDRQLPCGGIH